jgi:DNA-binding transcriptional LysR family regulator
LRAAAGRAFLPDCLPNFRVMSVQRRHAKKNIPIELLRSLVVVVESGGFTKAANALALTQSAVSAQIGRLAQIVGGDVFEKGPGIQVTKRGMIVLSYARRILMMNDELLSLAGPTQGPQNLLVGLPAWWSSLDLIEVASRCSVSPTGEKVIFRCDQVEVLIKDLSAGSIDLAFLCNVPEPFSQTIARWSEPLRWVKSPRLVLAPGDAIPLVSWAGTNPDRIALKLLKEHGMQYSIAFSAPDSALRRAAVVAGLGILPCLERVIAPGMEVVHDQLPALPDVKTGLFARQGLNLQRLDAFLRILEEALQPRSAAGPLTPPQRRHRKDPNGPRQMTKPGRRLRQAG